MAKAIKKLFINSIMTKRKQLNVRIPLHLQEKIDTDGRPKVDIVIEALDLYFDSREHIDDSQIDDPGFDSGSMTNKVIGVANSKNDSSFSKIDNVDSSELAGMENEIEYLRSKVDELIKLLHQEQILHIQTQHMLTAPDKPVYVRKWWQFWK